MKLNLTTLEPRDTPSALDGVLNLTVGGSQPQYVYVGVESHCEQSYCEKEHCEDAKRYIQLEVKDWNFALLPSPWDHAPLAEDVTSIDIRTHGKAGSRILLDDSLGSIPVTIHSGAKSHDNIWVDDLRNVTVYGGRNDDVFLAGDAGDTFTVTATGIKDERVVTVDLSTGERATLHGDKMRVTLGKDLGTVPNSGMGLVMFAEPQFTFQAGKAKPFVFEVV